MKLSDGYTVGVYYSLLSCGECMKFSMKALDFLDKVSNVELEEYFFSIVPWIILF